MSNALLAAQGLVRVSPNPLIEGVDVGDTPSVCQGNPLKWYPAPCFSNVITVIPAFRYR